MFKRKSGGGFVDVTNVRRRSSGSWVPVSFVRRRTNGSWVDVLGRPIELSPSTVEIRADGYNYPQDEKQFTNEVTITATGGSGAPKTFVWSDVSGETRMRLLSQNSQTTRWEASWRKYDTSFDAVWRCTVSDGTFTSHIDVYVTANRPDQF